MVSDTLKRVFLRPYLSLGKAKMVKVSNFTSAYSVLSVFDEVNANFILTQDNKALSNTLVFDIAQNSKPNAVILEKDQHSYDLLNSVDSNGGGITTREFFETFYEIAANKYATSSKVAVFGKKVGNQEYNYVLYELKGDETAGNIEGVYISPYSKILDTEALVNAANPYVEFGAALHQEVADYGTTIKRISDVNNQVHRYFIAVIDTDYFNIFTFPGYEMIDISEIEDYNVLYDVDDYANEELDFSDGDGVVTINKVEIEIDFI